MPEGVHWVLRKCVMYNQVWTIHPSPLRLFLHVKMYFLHVCVLDWNMGRHWLAVATFQTFKAKALRHIVLSPVWRLVNTLQTFTVSQIPESWTDCSYACFISANWLIIPKSQTSSLVWPVRHLVAAKSYVCMQAGVKAVLLSFWLKCLIFLRLYWWVGVVVFGNNKGWL